MFTITRFLLEDFEALKRLRAAYRENPKMDVVAAIKKMEKDDDLAKLKEPERAERRKDIMTRAMVDVVMNPRKIK